MYPFATLVLIASAVLAEEPPPQASQPLDEVLSFSYLENGPGGYTITLSNGRVFDFDELSADQNDGRYNSTVHFSSKSGQSEDAASIVVVGSGSPNIRWATDAGNRVSEFAKPFRAMINDVENAMMYEFMTDFSTEETIVLARKHSDLGNSYDDPDEEVEEKKLVRGKEGKTGKPSDRMLQSFSLGVRPNEDDVDVMIVWTRWAECSNAYPHMLPAPFPCSLNSWTEAAMLATIDLAVTQSNSVLRNSGVKSRLRLVHAYRDSNYVEDEIGGGDMFSHALRYFTFDDDAAEKRNFFGADVVSAFLYNPARQKFCGKAWAGKGEPVDEDKAFSAVDYRCATSRYDLIHEIAHNLGSFHDRGTEDKCTDDVKTISYGFRHPVYPYRSVMSYDCNIQGCDDNPNGRCAVLPILSGPNSKYAINDSRGNRVVATMGATWANNALYVAWAMTQAAQYREVSEATIGCRSSDDCPFSRTFSGGGSCVRGQCLY